MKTFNLILILSCLLPFSGLSQTPNFQVKWDKRYGGNMEDVITNFLVTSDSGFALCGTSYSGLSGDKSQGNYDTSLYSGDFWLVKTDSLAVKQWDKTYGGNNSEILVETILTADGGYLSGGQSFSGISGDKSQPNWDPSQVSNDYWIIKTDSVGNKQWDKRFGGTSFELIGGVRQTNDGGYVIAGSSFSGISGDKTQANQGSWDYWVVRTNSSGVKIWDKRFGGLEDDFATTIDKTADGGYVIGGYSKSNVGGDKTQPCQGNWDYWIVKINDQGAKVWDRTFGGNYTDWLFCMTRTTGGGFLLGGQSFSEVSGDKSEPNHDPTPASSDYWIVKIDAAGNKMWDHTFGGTQTEEITSVVQCADGGYLLGGESYSPADGNKTEANLGVEQSWVVKTDSAGIFLWDKTIFTNGHDESGSAVPYTDDCFVVVTLTEADTGGYVSEMSKGVGDYWIVKLCKQDPLAVPSIINSSTQWQIAPNPVNDVLTLLAPMNVFGQTHVEILDVNGKVIFSASPGKLIGTETDYLSIDIKNLSDGVYFCRIKDALNEVNLKFIKMR